MVMGDGYGQVSPSRCKFVASRNAAGEAIPPTKRRDASQEKCKKKRERKKERKRKENFHVARLHTL